MILAYATLTPTHDFVLRCNIFELGWKNIFYGLITDYDIIFLVSFLFNFTFL